MQERRVRWVIRSGLWQVFGLCLLLSAVAILINAVGIHIVGGIDNWEAWLARAYWFFVVWRVVLYAVILKLWLPRRRYHVAREPANKSRLLRAEIAFIAALALMEFTYSRPHW